MMYVTLITVSALALFARCDAPPGKDLLLITVATNTTDGFKRFMDSANYYKIPVQVLGTSEPWDGGSMESAGGGQKVNMLRKALKKIVSTEPNKIIMFTDGYDVILTSGADDIVRKFLSLDANIVFSAEVFCWPVRSLADSYPPTESPYKYLNSGGFIGYAKQIYELIRNEPIKDKDDDQLYYTKLYLNKKLRETYRMRLDTKVAIFQNLYGAQGDLKVEIEGEDYVIHNTKTTSRPVVVHGNGLSKLALNSLGNYMAGAWHPEKGCTRCPVHSPVAKERPTPFIMMTIFVNQRTPFIEEFFRKIGNLNYPKNRIHLLIYNSAPYHSKHISKFLEKFRSDYATVKEIIPTDNLKQGDARNIAVTLCMAKQCGYLFSVDSTAHLDNPHVLNYLIEDNKGVVAPLLIRPYKAWSNFWGDLNTDGFYARSFDYMDIVNNDKRGLWNVPHISECYLINATVLPHVESAFVSPNMDPDMAFTSHLRNNGIFIYVDNLADMGHLIDAENFVPEGVVNPELYQLVDNQWDWEQRYIHPQYRESLRPDAEHAQPCPDVYWFPIVTPRFCKELIEIMEGFGKWSTGSNHDERLLGGYENVPTRDIHMNQVGLEPLWLKFLQLYVRPLQEMVFVGYFHDPPKSLMNFVVRYRPDEQPSLRPHHDSSTYTINIALNRAGIDFQGGGCRFIRYKCSVTEMKVGWMLMHPGRLTHFHEGLLVTNGTRYIMISFVDP